jgi:hypothetical protein
MDPKKAITEQTEAAARDLYGARHAKRLRPVGWGKFATAQPDTLTILAARHAGLEAR